MEKMRDLAEYPGLEVMIWGKQNLEIFVPNFPVLLQVQQLFFEFLLVFFFVKYRSTDGFVFCGSTTMQPM